MMSCIKEPVVTWWLVVGEEEEFSSPMIRPQSFSEPVPTGLEISQVLLRVFFCLFVCFVFFFFSHPLRLCGMARKG